MAAKEKQFNLRLSQETHDRWRQAAEASGCSLTLWIERACNAAAFVALEQAAASRADRLEGVRVLLHEAQARLDALSAEQPEDAPQSHEDAL